MDEHFFYLLGKYVEAGDKGIIWNTEAQIIMKNYDYQRHLERSGPIGHDVGMFIGKHTTKNHIKDDYQNDIQKNVITTEGIAVYNLEKEIRDDKQREIEKEQLIKNQLLQVNQSVIDTNVSIATLNVKTLENFRVQKRLTWAIFIAAAVSAISATIPLFRDEKSTLQPLQDTLKSVQMKVQQLEQSQQYQSGNRLPPSKVGKIDSLTKP